MGVWRKMEAEVIAPQALLVTLAIEHGDFKVKLCKPKSKIPGC